MSRLASPRRVAAACLVLAALILWLRCGPLPEGFLDADARTSTEVVDRQGQRLYESPSLEGTRTRWMGPGRLPETLVAATLAAEDSRFFHHPGVDPLALLRAAWHDLRAGRLVEGGSTLTQQVVKQLSHRRRTAGGKLQEIVLALRLEHRLSKREILGLYLDLAPYGNQLLGAESASRAYFGAPTRNLTPAQAAFLTGLPQRPTAFNPYRSWDRALLRQRWVLQRMAATGRLSRADLTQARAEQLRLVKDARRLLAPHFVERVLAEGGERPPRRLETTLDLALQAEVAGILEAHRARLAEHGARDVAVAVLDNARGEWLAWEGSGAYFDAGSAGAIDGVVTPRQPGSALKPFTYALAFEQGFTPASVLPDLPAHFPTAVGGILYSPRNYDGRFRGPLRARPALAGSENVPAVWLLSQVGVTDLLRLLREAGLTTFDKTAEYYGFGLTMGDAEVRLDELVAAYSALARGGLYREPRRLAATVDADGRRSEVPEPPLRRILSERSAFWVTDILSDRHAREYIFGSGGSLDFAFPVAAKTGTSQAYRDNWTIGFTREVTVGVWVGNFDRSELRNSSGVTGAAPIFHDVLLAAQKRAPGRLPATSPSRVAEPPEGLEARSICALSGQEAGEACPRVETEWLPADPTRPRCHWHGREGSRTRVFWPPAYRAWAREQGLLTLAADAIRVASQPGAAPPVGARPQPEGPMLRIVNPPPGAIYLRDPTLRAAYQTLGLRAVTDGSARIQWEVDGRAVGAADPERPLEWPLALGQHIIGVTDERGRRDETHIVVR